MFIIIFSILLNINPAFSKPSLDFGFREFKINTKNDIINYYVSSFNNDFTEKKPLFIYIQGSGPAPIYEYEDGQFFNSLLVDPAKVNRDYYYVVITKPDIPFFSGEKGKSIEEYKEYNRKLSFEYRVNQTIKVINELSKFSWVDKSKIVLVGQSEGGNIVPKVAYLSNKVTHLVCLSVGAVNQMYDTVFYIRKKFKQEATFLG